MASDRYLYDLDQHPPFHLALIYGLQWAMIMFPGLIIAATLGVNGFGLKGGDELRFLQFTLFTSGFFTAVQTLWGHRYPLMEGPSTALVLSFILLAPQGMPVVQGGMMLGAVLVVLAVASGQLERVIPFFTPNVVGVVLMLIALGLLRPLFSFMAGMGDPESPGDYIVFLISIALVLCMSTLSHRLRGFGKSISLFLGMIIGSLLFLALGRLDGGMISGAEWFSFIRPWIVSTPAFSWPSLLAFACAYVAVIVNSLGSLQGTARVTESGRLKESTRRGILINGIGGVVCGFLGIVGTVSYSTSPGVVVVLRVASRYAVTYCGLILMAAAFVPKLAALLGAVPKPVVGAALCVAMGAQIGVGITTVASQPTTPRDYFVVGIPLLLGTAVGFLPSSFSSQIPGPLQVLIGNSLIVGISLVLLLEHVLLRK